MGGKRRPAADVVVVHSPGRKKSFDARAEKKDSKRERERALYIIHSGALLFITRAFSLCLVLILLRFVFFFFLSDLLCEERDDGGRTLRNIN